MESSGPAGSGSAHPSVRFGKLIDGIVFVCLLGLTILSVIPYGLVDAWWEALFECVVFVVTAIWMLELVFLGVPRVRSLFVVLPLVLITAYAFAQTVELPVAWLPAKIGRLTAQHTLSIDRYQTYLTARKALALTLFFGLLLLHTSTPKRLRWLIRAVIGLGLASALFGILRQFLQSPDSPAGFVLPILFYGMGYGQFLSPNPFAYLMEMPFGLLAGMILGGGVRRDRVLVYLAIIIPVWTALVLSNSRGGIVSLTIESILLLFVSLNWYAARQLSRKDGNLHRWFTFLRGSRLVRFLFVVLMVGVLFVGVFWMGGENLASKLHNEDSTRNIVDGATRTEIWRSSWELVKHNPWTGVGFGAYFLAIPEYQIGSGRLRLEQAHNDYLDLAANGGIVAVGLAGWFIAMIILRARSSLRSADAYRRTAALGAVAGIVGVGVHSFVDFGLQVTGLAVVFAALVVIAIADERVAEQSKP